MTGMGRVSKLGRRLWRGWATLSIGAALALAGGCSGKTRSSPDEGEGDGGSRAATGGDGGASNTSDASSTHSTTSAGNGGTLGGNGGNSGSGATGGGATGGVSDPGAPANVGAPCEDDAPCSVGLTCAEASSNLPGGGGPAHGLCTRQCGEQGEIDHEICQALDPNSRCNAVAGGAAFCFPGCDNRASGEKCQGRSDLACVPETQVCHPRCGSLTDCPLGRYCDPRSGLCVDDEPSGLAFDEPCDPTARVDPCQGSCSVDGTCVETCVLGSYPSCGSTSNTEGTADCLFSLNSEATAGDLGSCGRLCDCDRDCLGDTSCVQLRDAAGPFEYRGRAGVCDIAGADDHTLPCGAGGAGGSP